MKSKSKKPLPKLLKDAQKVFNSFIRHRDKDKGCISCGGPVQHAGHFIAVGNSGFLRFNEHNVNGQCVKCNTFLHGNLLNYRKGMIKKYGEEVVDYLESHQYYTRKHDRQELEEIINHYKI
jgi:hypothetical protein